MRASSTLLNGSEELTSRAASVLLELALAAGTFPGFRQLRGPPGVRRADRRDRRRDAPGSTGSRVEELVPCCL